MPQRRLPAYRSILCLTVSAGLILQSIAPVLAQPASGPGPSAASRQPDALGPLLSVTGDGGPAADESQPQTGQPLVDYRASVDPESQRTPATPTVLPLYGYDFFAPARQIIAARRQALQELLSQPSSSSSGLGSAASSAESQGHVATTDELTNVASLSDQQKVDLQRRALDHTLTPDEQQKYRLYLYPSTLNPGTPATTDEVTAMLALTPAARADLLTRQSQGSLTQDDSALYRILLFPAPEQLPPISPTAASELPSVTRPTQPQATNFGDSSDMYTSQPLYGASAAPEGAFGPAQPGMAGGPQAFPSGSSGLPGYGQATATGGPLRQAVPFNNGAGPGSQMGAPGEPSQAALPPVSAYSQIADPLALTLQQVIATAPSNYQISGGDRLTLRISSPTMEQQAVPLLVDEQGGLVVPNVGRMIVRGMTTAQAESALRERLRSVYRGVVVSLEIGQLRTIPVTVSGASFYPGTYQVPSVATAFNIIYATGGPTPDGTLRRIEVRRRGSLVGTLDVYKFLVGGAFADIPLQPGDVIHIPERYKRITVTGDVRHQAVFELLDSETLQDVIRFAGGIGASGLTQRVLISTLQPGTDRILKDVDLHTPEGAAAPLYDGDQVEVFTLRQRIANMVTVEGAVDQPGDYALTDGMTVADLVDDARGALSEAYTTRADLYRFNPDTSLTLIPIDLDKALSGDPAANVKLARWDKLKVYTRDEVAFLGRRDVTINGAVQHPGIYYRSDNMHVKDLLLQAGGTLPDAYTPRASLLHRNPDGTYAYQFIDLDAALHDDLTANASLKDHDVLAIFTNEQASFTKEHTVTVAGAVVLPGVYPRGEHMHLSDALKLAGGPVAAASTVVRVARSYVVGDQPPVAATLSPETGDVEPDVELADGDVVTLQGNGSYMVHPLIVSVIGAVNRPGPVVLPGRRVHLSQVIALAGGLRPEAYPEGAQFTRKQGLLSTDQQRTLATVVTAINDILSSADYKRALAQSDLNKLKAVSDAERAGPQVSLPGVIQPAGTPSGAGAAALFSRDLVTPARGLDLTALEADGGIAVNLAVALRRPNGADDVLMADGDIVSVPERPTTVQVVGAVYGSRSVVYHPGAGVAYYLDNAGGLTADAAKDRIEIIRAGGGLIPAKKVGQLHPGDMILVPTQVMAVNLNNHVGQYDSIFRSLTSWTIVFFIAKKLIGF